MDLAIFFGLFHLQISFKASPHHTAPGWSKPPSCRGENDLTQLVDATVKSHSITKSSDSWGEKERTGKQRNDITLIWLGKCFWAPAKDLLHCREGPLGAADDIHQGLHSRDLGIPAIQKVGPFKHPKTILKHLKGRGSGRCLESTHGHGRPWSPMATMTWHPGTLGHCRGLVSNWFKGVHTIPEQRERVELFPKGRGVPTIRSKIWKCWYQIPL